MLAASHPRLFRHLIAEGLAPELFYCWWLQGLFRSCFVSASGTGGSDELLRVWDIIVFERSHKLFVRIAVALIGLLEQRIAGRDVDQLMKLLWGGAEAWKLAPGALLKAALETKVTRGMLREVESMGSPAALGQ